jgi:hypothetical protein
MEVEIFRMGDDPSACRREVKLTEMCHRMSFTVLQDDRLCKPQFSGQGLVGWVPPDLSSELERQTQKQVCELGGPAGC